MYKAWRSGILCTKHDAVACYVQSMTQWHVMHKAGRSGMLCTKHDAVACYVQCMKQWHVIYKAWRNGMLTTKRDAVACYIQSMTQWHVMYKAWCNGMLCTKHDAVACYVQSMKQWHVMYKAWRSGMLCAKHEAVADEIFLFIYFPMFDKHSSSLSDIWEQRLELGHHCPSYAWYTYYYTHKTLRGFRFLGRSRGSFQFGRVTSSKISYLLTMTCYCYQTNYHLLQFTKSSWRCQNNKSFNVK